MKSWKTTLFGLMAAAGTSLPLLGDVPGWLRTLLILCGVLGTAGLGLAARDNNVTSEQAGAAAPPPRINRAPIYILALCLTLPLLGNGCMSQAALVRALAKDPATVSAKLSTVYGTASLVRVGGTTNTVTVSPDGTVTVGK